MRFALTEAKMGLAQMISKFEFVRVPETTDKLTILNGFALLKTSPINIGIKKRD